MAEKKYHEQHNHDQSLSQSARRRLKRSLNRRRERAKKGKAWLIRSIGTAFCLIVFLYIPYQIVGGIIMNYLVQRNGVCIKGIVTTNVRHIRYSKPNYLYKISVNGKEYMGNSLYTDERKVGDTICVLYLKSFPSNNKPINFFDPDERVNCDCK